MQWKQQSPPFGLTSWVFYFLVNLHGKEHNLEKEKKMNFFILFPSYLKELYLKIICIKCLFNLCRRKRSKKEKECYSNLSCLNGCNENGEDGSRMMEIDKIRYSLHVKG